MFPFGPSSPGGDEAAGAEESAAHRGPAAAARPPSPATPPAPPQPEADAALPPPAARSPSHPGALAPPHAAGAGELKPPGELELSATSAQGEPTASPDCRAWSRGRHGLSAGLGGPGARLFGWLRQRSLGRGLFVDPARDHFRTMTNLYCSIHPADSVYLSTRTHGAVFNLEYSPDG